MKAVKSIEFWKCMRTWCIFESKYILSRRFLEADSSDHFQILYSDFMDIGDKQRRSFDLKKWNVWELLNFENRLGLNAFSSQCAFCPGCFSKIIHRMVFKFYILFLQILKMCNVVVLVEKIENCKKKIGFWKYRRAVHLRINVYFVQVVSRSRWILFKCCIVMLQILKKCNVVVLIKKRKLSNLPVFENR